MMSKKRMCRFEEAPDMHIPRSSSPPFHEHSRTFVNLVSEEPPDENLLRNEDAEWLSARDLSNLSLEEREKVLYDIHGIAQNQEDSADFKNAKLAEMESFLKEQLVEESAYSLAMSMDSKYVKDPQFRLKFLRAEQYNSYNAATRLVRHMEAKQDLFGSERLCRDITQDDLSKRTLEYLYSGLIQDLPLRDMSGRVVTLVVGKKETLDYQTEEKLQRVFYASMVLSEDEETQKNGRVLVLWMEESVFDRSCSWKLSKLLSSSPGRVAAIHICIPKAEQYGTFLALVRYAVGAALRVRIRTHVGSPTELKYILQTFGIPAQTLPITSEGEILCDKENKKWASRREEERRREAVSISEGPQSREPYRVTTPSNVDVLLGRGRIYQDHVGNLHFRYIIEEQQETYDRAPKNVKSSMGMEIVRKVQSRNGRFLKEDGSGWVEVDDNIAKKKVTNCFRTARHVRKCKMQENSTGEGETKPVQS